MKDKTGQSHPLIVLLLLTQITGLRSTVPEPCLLNSIPEGIIATMCTSSSAVEEPTSGTFNNDSILLRIITHQDHCICQLTLLNQTKDETLYLRKQHGSEVAAPINDSCGLAVDIHHIPTGNHKAIDPIQCTKPNIPTKIPLVMNDMLQFESRKINGTFAKGYCMEILRVHSSSIQNPTINITCLEPDRSEETSELPTTKGGNQVPDTYNATSASTRLIPAQPTSTTSLVTRFEQYTENTQSQPDSKVHNSSIQNPTIKITCLEPDRSEETSELPTTKGGNQVPDTYNATSASTRLIPAQPTSTTSLVTGFEQYTENTQSQPDSKERGLTLYIAIGAGLGAVSLLIFVVTITVLKRQKSRQASATCIRKAEVNTKSYQYQHANKSPNNELRENSLYIPADQYNITADHYDMANLENRHIPDGQFNIAANHYNTANLENIHIPDGQYDIACDDYSHLHLKTQQISDKIFSNDSDHYSTLDMEKQQVVDKRFSSKDGYSEIVLSEHASPLKTSRDVSNIPDQDLIPLIKSSEMSDSNVLNKNTFQLPVENNTSNNMYAEVDKCHKRNEVKMDEVTKIDQTYAVVNKVAKLKHDDGGVNKGKK